MSLPMIIIEMVEKITTLTLPKRVHDRLSSLRGYRGETKRREGLYSVIERLLDHWEKTHEENQ